VATLIPEALGFGLAVAFTSPGSVVAMIALLSMSSGVRRALAFLGGWILAIGLLALVLLFVLHGQDFSTKHTTPSRIASAVEVLLGVILFGVSAWAYRRPGRQSKSTSKPAWLERVDRSGWQLEIVVGAIMLSYALTLAAGAEILKANVGGLEAATAELVFAVASIVTIAAPVLVVLIAPDRSAQVLAGWRDWLVANARSIALIALMVIGAFLVAKGAYDLAA
jgi:hypothetical protein